jgi:ribosomal protein L40E
MKIRRHKAAEQGDAAEVRICSSCNSDLAPEWTTCRICGAVVAGGMTRAPAPPTRSSFNDNLNSVLGGVNNQSRGLWGPERYDPRDGEPK